MHELFYSPVDVARIIGRHMLPITDAMKLTRRIWQEDNAYLRSEYRSDYKKWALAVMYWSDYMQDKAAMDAEFPAVQEMCGRELSDESMLRDDFDMDLFFKDLRIRILFISKNECVWMKLRTLLEDYGYKRRSREFIRFVKDRLYFYHIQTALTGNHICDVETMDRLDDRITFRVL